MEVGDFVKDCGFSDGHGWVWGGPRILVVFTDKKIKHLIDETNTWKRAQRSSH
jgi:hypothetical protein